MLNLNQMPIKFSKEGRSVIENEFVSFSILNSMKVTTNLGEVAEKESEVSSQFKPNYED